MDKQMFYIEMLVSVFSVIIILLSAFQEQRPVIYFGYILVAYYTITIIFMPRKRTFDIAGISLFCIFYYFVLMHIINLLNII
jgi:hypothetical protein